MAENGSVASLEAVFAGDGEMARLMRAFDWSQTPLGGPERWSPSLRTMVRLLLTNRFPTLLWWGPDLCQFYNDAYRPVLGSKHPRALGQAGRACWPEIWHIIGPLALTPYHGGPATWDDDLFLELNRHGFVEETHFTIAYSPVSDESVPGGIGGVLATVHEITPQVLQERRLAVLRDLGAPSAVARNAEEAGAIAAATLGRHPRDIPFALIYLLDEAQGIGRLAGAAGLPKGGPTSPLFVDLRLDDGLTTSWPLAAVAQAEEARVVENLRERFEAVPCGAWSDPPNQAMVFPVPSNLLHQLAGLLVLGLSPRLRLDDQYRGFCELVTAQVATTIANACALEEQRRRAEALAELDRAKTLFFSNVSHEFRTPLTLMLGPLEDARNRLDQALVGPDLALVHRNGLRLLKLVNSLLDFSRIEAGRIQASYEAVDLGALTIDLASVFRSAIERAGLRFVIDCPPLPEPIYLDREMWEKVVFNLLSNAFKFTFDGDIRVTLRWVKDHAVLEVRDTGIGIPAVELPRVFERFHRIEGARGRTQEGSGIGLALVDELVRLHGGSVHVESVEGEGTAFTVSLPGGSAHLPPERVGAPRDQVSTALGAAPYVEEALRWLPNQEGVSAWPPATDVDTWVGEPRSPSSERRARVLIADDNADLREYVGRLLADQFDVDTVADGVRALEVARTHRPDLILADVMMPGLDGYALLQQLRRDPRTSTRPVILLSARAGEEARVEGLRAGADDYLVKPFSARELLVRVRAILELTRVRQEAERTLRIAIDDQKRSTARAMRLEALAAALLDAIQPAEVARLVLEHGVPATDARAGVIALLSSDRADLEIVEAAGYAAESVAEWKRFPLTAPVPLAEAARRATTILLESRAAALEAYPALESTARFPAVGEATASIPLVVGGQAIGALGLGFASGRALDDADLVFLRTLADLCAQALERARLLSTERAQQARLAALAMASAAFAQTGLDLPGVLDAVARHVAEAFGDYCHLSLLEPDGERLTLAASHHHDPVVVDVGRSLADATPQRVGTGLSGRVAATGEPILMAEIDQERLRAQVRPEHRAWLERYRVHSLMIVPLRARGQIIGTLGVSRHAERQPYNAADLAFFQDLAERGALAIANAQLYHQAEAALRSRDEFLSIAAHELKTPITGLRGAAQLMLHRLDDRSRPDSDKLAQTIRLFDRQSTKLVALINQLLDVSRIETGQLRLAPARTDLSGLVQDVAELARGRSSRHSILVLTPGPLPMMLDPLRLEQVLTNLLDNAIKYAPNGGQVRLQVTHPVDGWVAIEVRDPGIGVAPEHRAHLFERYYQAHRDSGLAGLGLGLYVSRQIVELHGGRLRAEFPSEGGSCFVVELPVGKGDLE